MCAIAGMINLKHTDAVVDTMLDTMRRRGPDDTGKEIIDNCCLLHTRLAIIDPAGGKQPMTICVNGEIYTIVYNGELYNTNEIRNQLQKMGHTFTGHSDTEVVLHAYAQWGEDCLQQMNGIFAFAVWEDQGRRLFLARDRMGVKPLFYMQHKNGFIFASEIKTILAYPGVPRELDAEGVGEIFLLGPGRTPGSGVFRNIFELKPGYCAYFFDRRIAVKQYWSLKDREHLESLEDTADHVRYLVLDAIKRQMVSDVPIGTFLSGGLDSSLISSVCAEKLLESNEKLTTFSVDYKDNALYFKPEKFQPNSDNEYIHIMQKKMDSNHHWTVLTPDDLLSGLQSATLARDLPGMADVDFSLLLFCRDIRREVKVALSGECADEIFGGYPWYTDPDVLAQNGFPWSQNAAFRSSFLNKNYYDKLNSEEFIMERYKAALSECDIRPETPESERKIKRMVNLNQQWFMQTLLDRKDRMSMYNGLEVRVPFCDHRIAEYMYGVPWDFKYYRGKEKGLLRYAMRGILPEEVLWRKKSPYPKTWDPYYTKLVKESLIVVIDNKNAPIHQIVSKDALEALLNSDNHWPWYGQLMRTPQTIAYMLQINFWLAQYNIQLV